MNNIFFFFILVISSLQLHSQTKLLDFSRKNYGLIARRLGEADGLPSAIVQNFIVDKKGFFWFATGSGLIKYDGINSTTFDVDNTAGLLNSAINHINEDYDGNIWISYHVRGLSIKRGNDFYSFGEKENLSDVTVSKIFTDEKGVTWIGTLQHGLFKYENKKFKKVVFPKNLLLKNILSISNLNKDTLLAGTGYGLLKVVNDTASLIALPNLPSPWCRSIFIDSKKRIWIGTNKGLAVYSNEKKIYENIFAALTNDLILKVHEDKNGNFWIATYNSGMFIFNESMMKLFPLNKEHGLTDDRIVAFQVVDNHVWIASRTGGIDLLKPATFEVISAHNGLADEFVNCIYEDSPNNYIAGTTTGMYNISHADGKFVARKSLLLPNDHIYFITRDKRNNLLVATRTSGIHLFSKTTHEVYNITNILRINFIRSIFIDDDNTYWFGTNGAGICVVNGKNVHYFNQSNGLNNTYISFIFKRKNEDIVAGTSGGGLYFIRNNKIYKNLNEKNGLGTNILSGFYEEPDGTLWFSSPEGGLIRIKDTLIQHIRKRDGLHTNNLNNIIYDEKSKFWFSTQTGIFSISKSEAENYFNKTASKVTSEIFGKGDGMLSEVCSYATQLSANLLSNGNIMISTLKGLVVIDPDRIQKRKEKIESYISDFFWNEFRAGDEKEIGPGVNRLELNFSAKTMIEPRFINFRYKLIPVDAEFSSRASTNKAVYTNLSHGNYNFILIASKGTESENSDTLQFTFTIRPFFYETTLFRIVAGILLTSLIALIVVFAVRKSYSKKITALETQHQLEKERIRISKDMHDELGAIVTRINLLSEVGKQNVDDTQPAKKYLNQISETGIELASTMDEIVWAVNPGNDRLDKLVFYIIQFAENILSLASITLSVSVPDEIEEKYITAEIRHNIFLIIKEVINNIIKHSEAKNVKIEIKIPGDRIEIRIDDDGKGFNIDEIDQFSNGLSNLKQRTKNVNGKININSKPNEGTKIFLTAPI